MNHIDRHDQEYLAQKIRAQYTQRQRTELDELKALDHKVKAPANGFAYVFGTVAALALGAGMSLVMTDIGAQLGISNPMPIGVIIGIIGMAMAIVNYPIFKAILSSRKNKYADRILSLSEKIMREEG